MNRCLRWPAHLLMVLVLLAVACGRDNGDEPSAPGSPADAPTATSPTGQHGSASATSTTGTQNATEAPDAPTATDVPTLDPTPTEVNTSDNGDDSTGDLEPCEILTQEEVATVLPETDEGFVAASGGSLMEGVDAYQCSYTNPAFDGFTLVINIASTLDDFEWIEPHPDSFGDEGREVDVADGGWLRGDDSDMKLTVVKGWAVIDLELMATGAIERSEALIDLARIVAERIE